MSLKKGNLYIQGSKFVPKICVPTVGEVINPDNQEEIDKMRLVEGEPKANEGCVFKGCTMAIQGLDDVRNGNIKMKQIHGRAKHIVCAFRLPGKEIHQLQGMIDDGEWGASRQLLSLLENNEIQHRVVYVARYYGGSKLGPARFTSYAEVTRSAVACDSFDNITKKNDLVVLDYKMKQLKPHRTTLNGHGCGRGSMTRTPAIRPEESAEVLRHSTWASPPNIQH